MKIIKFFILGLYLLLFINCISNNVKEKPLNVTHEGTWTGKNNLGQNFHLKLTPDGYADLSIDKKSAAPFDNYSKIYYVINYDKNPIFLDIIYTRKESKSVVYKFIIEFLSKNMFRISGNLDGNRPINFEDDKTFLLKKKF
ncbi:MAG TPA: hypothetical protein PK385_05235 [Spirochaetota bacterium]|nr:hypothetical protein [Spirochaetota bacterium]HOS32099.1 hypothetical protein [Spirochaetota bacterium]HOS55440.1 hypothetical protein [Spirochaetota bacterium]HPK60852.1 hypothetical protein [Spirochaetota bacterium]HQF78000.1 hypothetical protein [Spirochaetota bacterium]